ncbi:hypothetical protein BD779DRAFT_1027615 [Infundibulicybe gibba]|nr:hypothetical protein BD779DRAFT_1027615 [Infundibulicybe gibba]
MESPMPFCGGLNGNTCILLFRGWPSITFQSLPRQLTLNVPLAWGELVLSHVRNRLSVQSTRAVLCLNAWSRLGLVKDCDIKAATALAELKGEEEDLQPGWDHIKLDY